MDLMGKRIKEKRASFGYLVKYLSAKIGVTPSLISEIEQGKSFPSIVTFKKHSGTLQTTDDGLIGKHENLTQNSLTNLKI